jgi:hypothetical protein
MSFKPTKKLISCIVPGIISGIVLALLAAPAAAETAEVTRTSKSISFTRSSEIDLVSKDAQLKQAEVDIMLPLIKQGFRTEAKVASIYIESTGYNNIGDFTLYDASTELISDFNNDGFYHRFSVAIDADTIYDTAYVYARLYLSYEGGPWNHYASSDAYHIHGDSELDTFIIETELADGFAPGYYDVRIELYDADYDELLLNYGPYDDASLSALPLEDSYADDSLTLAVYPVETEIVVAGSGSMSWWLLAVPVLIAVARRVVRR